MGVQLAFGLGPRGWGSDGADHQPSSQGGWEEFEDVEAGREPARPCSDSRSWAHRIAQTVRHGGAVSATAVKDGWSSGTAGGAAVAVRAAEANLRPGERALHGGAWFTMRSLLSTT
eukprot:COSAG02_NODE_2840_length_7915_cov_7.736054_8_plen_116_part_00